MTNGLATATVETLAAEVRVLMVGSRQVTLSVYRQLDWVEPAAITSFGRVNTGRKRDPDEDAGGVELVGVNDAGELVQSCIWPPDWCSPAPLTFLHWAWHQRPTTFRNPCTSARYRTYELKWRHHSPPDICPAARRPGWHESETCWEHNGSPEKQWLCAEYEHLRNRGEFCNIDELERTWRAKAADELGQLAAEQVLYEELCRLPLIVLAGLR